MPAKKADLDTIKRVLVRNELDIRQVSQIIEDINKELAKDEEPKEPMVRKQFVLLVSDPEEKLKGTDMTGWVVQIPEEDSPFTAKEKIHRASYEFNVSPKGRRFPIESVGEACESIPARIFKEQQVWVKTKEPILVVCTDNKIPKATREE